MVNPRCKLLFVVLTYFILTNTSVSPLAATYNSIVKPAPINLTATVPGYWRLELTGWTSPYATVTFRMAQKIKVETNANIDGKFTFVLILPRKLDPFCLIAKDIAGVTSHPLCLAPPPADIEILVKEVVMPPTINIVRGNILHGETIAAQGYTTPNSEVTPFLFGEYKISPVNKSILGTFSRFPISNFQFLISNIPAYAVELPKPNIKSDRNGFYQFNLPTTELGKNRIFIGSYFLNNPSPKSNILVYHILTYWQEILLRIINLIIFAFTSLMNFLISLPGVILSELIAVILLLVFLLRKKKTKALYLNPNKALIQQPEKRLKKNP